MYVSSTAAIRSNFNALSVLQHVLNSSTASLWVLMISAICAAVDPGGTAGFWPGLAGGTKGVADKVPYTAGLRVKKMWPNCPSPRFECTDAALALSFRCNSARLSQVGCPMMG